MTATTSRWGQREATRRRTVLLLHLLAGRALLWPEGRDSRRVEGRTHAFQHVECLKAAADDVIEQHFDCYYDAKVASKWEGELEKGWGRLTAEHEDGHAEVNAEAHRRGAYTLQQQHVQQLAHSKRVSRGSDPGKEADNVLLRWRVLSARRVLSCADPTRQHACLTHLLKRFVSGRSLAQTVANVAEIIRLVRLVGGRRGVFVSVIVADAHVSEGHAT